MKIYFVRHGQTNNNHKRLIQGRVDAPLNQTGQKQAKTAGQALKAEKVSFDKIISSPLSRALETAYLVGRKINYKENILINENFLERDFGNYEMTLIAESFPIIMTEGFTEEFYEDDKTMVTRVKLGLDQIYKEFSNDTVIVTCHAHVIRSMYILFNSDKYNFMNFFLGNGSIHVFDYDGTNISLSHTLLNEEV